MSFLSQARLGATTRAKIFMLYGVPGIGKTTAFANLPNAVIIPTEDNQDHIDNAIVLPLAKTFDDVIAMIYEIGNADPEQFPCENLGIDSVSSLDRLINQKVCEEHGVDQVEKIPYGKGREYALTHWDTFWKTIAEFREFRKANVVLIAHPKISKVPNPEGESYDAYSPDLNEKALKKLHQNCNGIFFCNFKVFVKVSEKGFGQKEAKAVGGNDRVIFTQNKPTHMAKNASKNPLPAEMPLDLNALLEAWSA